MRTKHWTTLLVAAAALAMWGCEDYSGTSSQPAAPDAVDVHTDAAETHTDAAQEHLDAAQEQIGQGVDQSLEESSVAVQNARPLLDQALADIKAGRYEQAEMALDQLEDMDLPESFDQQIANARSLLDTQKEVQPRAEDDIPDAPGVTGY